MNYGTGPNQDPNVAGQQPGYSASGTEAPPPGYVPVAPPPADPNPSLAAAVLLGFIPGVGAMYNGQYAKAGVHVVVFAILVSLSADANGVFGIFVAAWIAYMAFDSYHTARARRDGTPLPNPFGLNDAASWFQGRAPGSAAAYNAGRTTPFASGFTSSTPPQPSQPPQGGAYYPPPVPPVPPTGVDPYDPACCPPSRAPVGAIILIGLGVLFLLSTFDVFSARWIAHGWPLILIGLGVYLIMNRLQPRSGQGGAR